MNSTANPIDRNKLIKMIAVLFLLLMAVGAITHLHRKNSMTLDEYARLHSEQTEDNQADTAPAPSGAADSQGKNGADGSPASGGTDPATSGMVSGNDAPDAPIHDDAPVSSLTGALLNGGADGRAMLAERVTYVNADGGTEEDFYQEPLSEALLRYMTGVSYPAVPEDASDTPAISPEELRYLHILHYNFEGVPAEGELVCNVSIAADLLDIFYELYRSEYRLEQVRLIDEYDGDDTASMEANNTSCFNYREVEGTDRLSKHALGLALDINPFYNPYVTYEKDGSIRISPAEASAYADRKLQFPYKIDEEDLCYKLFTGHGFTWGGNWNSSKDYQHFQKAQ
ncbi:MAG: M15 family metallopeptidase [Muribaculum sp.]|nr:M15 family metallopeptidase [Muribaculum sp.]